METLAAIYRHGLWFAVPGLALGIFLLVVFIGKAARLGQETMICAVPLTARQDVEFHRPGPVILCMDGPHLTTRFARLSFTLHTSDGRELKGRPVVFRTRTSGLKTVRLELRRYELPRAGHYLLQIEGLGEPRPGDQRCRVVFCEPHLPRTIAAVLGILAGAILTILSLVLGLMRLFGVAGSAGG